MDTPLHHGIKVLWNHTRRLVQQLLPQNTVGFLHRSSGALPSAADITKTIACPFPIRPSTDSDLDEHTPSEAKINRIKGEPTSGESYQRWNNPSAVWTDRGTINTNHTEIHNGDRWSNQRTSNVRTDIRSKVDSDPSSHKRCRKQQPGMTVFPAIKNIRPRPARPSLNPAAINAYAISRPKPPPHQPKERHSNPPLNALRNLIQLTIKPKTKTKATISPRIKIHQTIHTKTKAKTASSTPGGLEKMPLNRSAKTPQLQ